MMKVGTSLALLALLPAGALALEAQDALSLQHEVEELRAKVAALQEIAVKEADERRLTAVASLTQAELDAATADLGGAMDSIWLVVCGTLVMFMHAGFAMLETGCCRAKNASNVLMKNLTNVCVGTLAWYFFGWGFAYGNPDEDGDGLMDNGFMGTSQFFAAGFVEADPETGVITGGGVSSPGQSMMLGWFFQWAFCTAAATIVSGGVAERVKSPTYAIYSFVMAAFIYPVVVAWTWGYGWIGGGLMDVGYMDFAGSGIVHLTGGAAALAGAAVLGPRKGRFDNPEDFEAHNVPLMVLGTLSLWFGWYGFNCGSTLGLSSSAAGAMAAQVAMNTTLSAASGGLAAFALTFAITKCYDVGAFCNGILSGLVSITAGCGNVECFPAILMGSIGGCIFVGSSKLQKKLKIDDPVDASSVHGACGIWGVIACGLFDWGKGFDTFHGWSGFSCMTNDDGTCQEGIWGTALVVQIITPLVICLWSGGLSMIAFFALMKTGMLRVNEDVEEKGMDKAHHSPSKAYDISAVKA